MLSSAAFLFSFLTHSISPPLQQGAMEQNQAFRLTGTTTVKYLAVDHVNGQDVIFREIQEVFPSVKHVQHGCVVLSKLKEADGVW